MNSIGKNSTRTYSYDDEGDYETPYADETYTEYNFGAEHDNLSKHKNLKSADENSKVYWLLKHNEQWTVDFFAGLLQKMIYDSTNKIQF